jgi:hypothetical protein
VTDGLVVEIIARDRDDVVPVDDAGLGEAVLDVEFHF